MTQQGLLWRRVVCFHALQLYVVVSVEVDMCGNGAAFWFRKAMRKNSTIVALDV